MREPISLMSPSCITRSVLKLVIPRLGSLSWFLTSACSVACGTDLFSKPCLGQGAQLEEPPALDARNLLGKFSSTAVFSTAPRAFVLLEMGVWTYQPHGQKSIGSLFFSNGDSCFLAECGRVIRVQIFQSFQHKPERNLCLVLMRFFWFQKFRF